MRKTVKRLAAVSIGLLLGPRVTDSIPKQRNSRRAFSDFHPTLGWIGARNYTARIRRDGFDALVAGRRFPTSSPSGPSSGPS